MPGSPESNKPNHEWWAPKPQPESTTNPFALLWREQRGGGEPTHEELVGRIRERLAAYIEVMKPYEKYDPVDAMREVLILGHGDLIRKYCPELLDKPSWEQPNAQLFMAWDLIALPYYKSKRSRGLGKAYLEGDAEHLGHTITLDENESKLLSAMAEAVGIPNPFGPKTPEKK